MSDEEIINELSKQFLEFYNLEHALLIIDFLESKKLIDIGISFIKYLLEVFSDKMIIYLKLFSFYKLNKQYTDCLEICDILCNLSSTKEDIYLISQLKFSITEFIINDQIYYPEEKIKNIKNSRYNLITFTITTCKRLELFKKTMNSFINCCLDLHKIDEWICIDDNSSEEDLKYMEEYYPFLKIYKKKQDEKGHVKSMNIIKNLVKTPFLFHIEDDFQFYEKKNYLTDCLDIISSSNIYGQCLINKNYAELPEHCYSIGGLLMFTESNKKYFLHQYVSNKIEENEWFEYNKYIKSEKCFHTNYWKHFSFRPSLIKTEVFKNIGDFKDIPFFEQEYAERYIKYGYKSVFLPSIYCKHIGRLTTERFDISKDNAYILNNEEQFLHKIDESVFKTITDDYSFKAFVVNLESRPDRLDNFYKLTNKLNLNFFNKFTAVYGKNLKPTFQLYRIFDGNDYNMKCGIVGCALSHIQLYMNLVNENDDTQFYLIVEDDVEFDTLFKHMFLDILKKINNINYDVIYLGHHNIFHEQSNYNIILEKYSKRQSFERSYGGSFAYIISKSGAQKMLDLINETGMTNAIDTMVQNYADIMNVFYISYNIIKSKMVLISNNNEEEKVDSNVQYDFNNLDKTIEDFLNDEILYYNNKKPLKKLNDLNDLNDSQDNWYFYINQKNIEKEIKETIELKLSDDETNDDETNDDETSDDETSLDLENIENYCLINNLKYYMYKNSLIFVILDKNFDYEDRYFNRFKINNKYHLDIEYK
jgi:GR25 family glycosyltransferase involved in LPS biosynthesis